MYRLILAGIIWISVCLGAGAADRELRVVANTWPPYVADDLPHHGLAADIVVSALKRAGYSVTFSIDTWPRALAGASVGVFDVVGAIWYTEDRAKTLAFSKPYLTNEIRFIKRKADPITYDTLSDLRGLLIGVVEKYAYDEAFVQSRELIKLPQNHLVQNLLRLVESQIDLTLDDERAIRYNLQKYLRGSIEQLQFLPKPLSSRTLHIAVSKTNPQFREIVTAFDGVLGQMKADGSYDEIVRRHQAEQLSSDTPRLGSGASSR